VTRWAQIRALLGRETLKSRDIADRLGVPCSVISATLQTYLRRGQVIRIRQSARDIYWTLTPAALRAALRRDPYRDPVSGDVFASRYNGVRRRVINVYRSRHGGLKAVLYEHVPSSGHRIRITGDTWRAWTRYRRGAEIETRGAP
jgi:hypothetical protein